MEIEERSTAAKIRDAAIECFATEGITGTTVRKVANIAGVSPGSVINHFGSMEGLRAACDHHLIETTRDRKQRAMAAGPNLDMLAAFREGTNPHLMAYLAAVLADDSPSMSRLVDDMVTDAEKYLEQGVESGMLVQSSDPRGRAIVLVLWNLGLLSLHGHMKRLLGVDLTDPDFSSSPDLVRYLAPIMEIYGDGVFTEEFMTNARQAMTQLEQQPTTAAPHDREIEKGTK